MKTMLKTEFLPKTRFLPLINLRRIKFMLITTLGTSHGNHTYCRFNSSTLFEIGERSYLVDAGEPVNGLMIRAKKSFDNLKAVFITHIHEDHIGGLPDLIKALLKYPKDERHSDIYLPEAAAIPGLEGWLKAMRLRWPSPMITLNVTKPGRIFDDGTLNATAIGTRHIKHSEFAVSFAYQLEAEGKRVIYTGDLSGDFSDFPQIAQREPCDLCICEMTHFPPEKALPVLMKSPIRRLIFNHIHDPWHGEGEEKLKQIFAPLPYPFEIAHDGDVFEL